MKDEDFRTKYKYDSEKDKIDEGSFGTVYRVTKNDTKEKRAIKLIDIKKYKKDYQKMKHKLPSDEDIKKYKESIIKEIKLLELMEGINQENQNTVKLYEYYDHNEEIAIVMELCDENLNTMIINKNQIFTISEIIEILNQLNNSFKIMYENKMAHRDLKPENILVKYKNENDKNNYIIKLSDYGEAKKLSMSKKVFSTKYIGTQNYMAPEILMGEPYDLKCDLWSLGVIIYILYFREHPYPTAKSDIALINQINNYGQKYFKKSENEDFDNLISKLLIKDPEKRISWEEYFKHTFLTLNQILITLKINKEDVDKKILILNDIDDNGNKNEEIEKLNNNDLELFINNKLYEFKKYFIPEKEGEYNIKINLKKKLKNLSNIFNNCKNKI